MFGPASELRKEKAPTDGGESAAVFADRIELLYRLSRNHLFLPFSAFCVVAILWTGREPISLVALPLLLQILAAVATAVLAGSYWRRNASDNPAIWAERFTFVSAASGAAWGVGSVIWFVPDSFPAEAFIALAFLGMTATEFIARCAHRPAYVAHAVLSLGPLALRLLLADNLYASLSAVLVLFFGGILYADCNAMANLLDASLRLRRHNDDLVSQLSLEKHEAETARDMAEASARAKSAFIANISHELRTPLNALLGMAQLLERSDLDRAQRSHVGALLEAGMGLKTLLDDVIALSRDEDGARSQHDEACDGAQAARTVARVLQPRAWEKQLKLSVRVAPDLSPVAADSRRVRQVLLKLTDNALKFTQRGSIELSVENDGPHLRFSVSDTGLGVSEETRPRIFEPFATGDVSYTRRQDGAGLGLAVAKRIVEQLGGEIGFESEVGHGSTFWFTLPAITASRAEPSQGMAIAGDAPPPWGLSILVWCPQDPICSQIANMLEPFGNRIVLAESISNATVLAGRENFDALIVGSDDADSIATASAHRAPILAVLAGGARAPDSVADVLRWPANPGALYAALRDLLGRGADASLKAASKEQPAASIDAPAFAALEKSLGLSTLMEILQAYIGNAEALCGALSDASGKQGWDDATRIAQDIAGAAGGLGLAALMAAARTFAQNVRDGSSAEQLESAAQTVVEEHNRVRRALLNLYPELAA